LELSFAGLILALLISIPGGVLAFVLYQAQARGPRLILRSR